jgi:ATP-binding cassette subfamily F protein 3
LEGNYDTYAQWLRQQSPAPARPIASTAASAGRQPENRANDKPSRRKRRFPYRKVADLEADIAGCEQRIAELHTAMGSPEVLREGDRVKSTMAELERQQQALAALYEHWEEAMELN